MVFPPGQITAQPQPQAQAPIQQLDYIVLDVSRSMKVRSTLDPLMTREDLSKLVFHAMVDGFLAIELEHAVGLVTFGEEIGPHPLTREYEAFHTTLGRMDAREGRTRLYDAIAAAAAHLVAYKEAHAATMAEGVALRVYVLSDGEDNASTAKPFEVVQQLRDRGIVLDALPMAHFNRTLLAMTRATGGLCVDVTSLQQAMALFSDVAMMHLPARPPLHGDAAEAVRTAVASAEELLALAPEGARAAVVVAVAAQNATVGAREGAGSGSGGLSQSSSPVCGGAAARRIMKELADLVATPLDGISAAPTNEGNIDEWSAHISGPPGTPFEGGRFQLHVVFPPDYPFKPPRVTFTTPVYHPNVNSSGNICLDMLKSQWSPALTIGRVLLAITALLQAANPDDPLDPFKADQYKNDRAAFDAAARAMTERHAK